MKRPDSDTLDRLADMSFDINGHFDTAWHESKSGGNETESIHQWNLGVQKLNELNRLVFPQSEVINEVTSDVLSQSPEARQEQFNRIGKEVD